MWFGEATTGVSFVGVPQALYLIVMSPWVLVLVSALRTQHWVLPQPPQREEVKGFCQPARDGVGLEQGWGEELQIWGEAWSPICGKWRQDLANIFIVEPIRASNGVIPSHFYIFETTCLSSHLFTSAFCPAWYSSLFFPYHVAYAFYAEGQRMGTNSFWNQAELLLPFFPLILCFSLLH